MDLKVFLSYIANHFNVVFGSILGLFFATSTILLFRSVREKGAEGGTAHVDLDAIEGVVKRALASQPVTVAAGAHVAAHDAAPVAEHHATADAPATVPAEAGAPADSANEIVNLKREIDRLKLMTPTAAEKAAADSGGGGEVAELKKKLDEAQARLSEYEIIEDDIADLSMFKDENARLKAEIETMKSTVAAAPAAAAVTASEPVSSFAAEPAKEIAFEKMDRFELDPDDAIVKEFAAAVVDQDGLAKASAAAVATSTDDAQAAIDAMLAGEPAAEPVDPQAAIDAMLAGEPVAAPVDPQAAIDAMLAGAPAAEPVDPQAAIDAMLAGTPAPEPVADSQSDIDAILAQAQVEEEVAESTDANKLIDEAVTLAETADSVEDVDALNEGLDAEKLAAEADELEKEQKAG